MQNEKRHVQQQIQEILVENNLINSKLENLKSASICTTPLNVRSASDSRDDATREKLTNEAFQNVKKQIDYLQAENHDLRSLNKNFQKTIENLENEIQSYRNQFFDRISVSEVKHKYTTALKILETTISHKNCELKEKAKIIESLFKQKELLHKRIEGVEKSLQEKSGELEKFAGHAETFRKLQEQLAESESQNKELQKSLKISRQAIEKRFKREQSALQKVQEALNIAEAAVADKEEALKRERVVKEECDNIASTIGQVMDEAARKVESDMEAIKNNFIEKEKALNLEKTKLSDEVQNQKNFIQILDTRCKRFQQKYRDAMKDNNGLSDQLEQAAKALSELEEKIKRVEYHNNEEYLQQSNSTDQDNNIQQFVKSNRLLRERYNATISDLTKKFEEKIYNLQDEVARYKAENQALKLQKNA